MADHLSFADIIKAVERGTKQLKKTEEELIKAMINLVYFRMMGADQLYPLFWMVEFDDTKEAYAPATITGISEAASAVITAVNTFNVGDLVTIHNVEGMTEINDKIGYISAADAAEITVTINSAAFTAWTSGGTVHHRGATLAPTGGVQKILHASWHDENMMAPITPLSIEEQYHFTDDTSQPDRYYHGKSYAADGDELNQIIWHPGADQAYSLRYWYEARPSRLTNGDHVPKMPPQFHYGLVAGTIAVLEDRSVQVQNKSIWPAIYSQITQDMLEYNGRYWKDHENEQGITPYML